MEIRKEVGPEHLGKKVRVWDKDGEEPGKEPEERYLICIVPDQYLFTDLRKYSCIDDGLAEKLFEEKGLICCVNQWERAEPIE